MTKKSVNHDDASILVTKVHLSLVCIEFRQNESEEVSPSDDYNIMYALLVS